MHALCLASFLRIPFLTLCLHWDLAGTGGQFVVSAGETNQSHSGNRKDKTGNNLVVVLLQPRGVGFSLLCSSLDLDLFDLVDLEREEKLV